MIAVIGDVHGCFHTLKELVGNVRDKYSGIQIISVGDIVDRGHYSFESFEFILKENIIFTPGNHDYMFYYYFNHPTSPIAKTWIYNGSETTLESYSKHKMKMHEHFNFIINSPLYMNLNDCFISHAGISSYYRKKLPRDPISDIDLLEEYINGSIESEHGVLWNRDVLLNVGKLQIVGHTRQSEITYNKESHSVYIDTGVYSGGKLSCIIVERGEIKDVLAVNTINKDISRSPFHK